MSSMDTAVENQAGDFQKSDQKRSSAQSPRELHGAQLVLLCFAVGLICLLVWLDEGILATAIPSISDEFRAFNDLAWYAPSYLFGLSVFQMPFGRIYTDFPTRPTFLLSLLVFEVASIVQAAAPNSPAFIVGRVFAGMGGSGVLEGALVLVTEHVPRQKAPFVMGLLSWVHGVGGIAGPIMGGAIASSHLTWRWCFWINPIFSAVALLPILIYWKGRVFAQSASTGARPPVIQVLKQLDYLGMLTIAAATACLLVALQLGGSSLTWSDRRTIALLVTAAVLGIAFIVTEWFKGELAVVPGRIAGMRVVALGAAYSLLLDSAYYIFVYYAVKGVSAQESGYRILPLLAFAIACNFSSATLAGKLRYYHPFLALGSILATIGAGLLTTLNPGAVKARWACFQILTGAGAGMGGQLPLIGIHNSLSKADAPIGYAVVGTAGELGSSIALAIAQALFGSELRGNLRALGIDFDTKATGASDLQKQVPAGRLSESLDIYSRALTRSWYLAVAMSGLSLFAALGMKWQRMNDEEVHNDRACDENDDAQECRNEEKGVSARS